MHIKCSNLPEESAWLNIVFKRVTFNKSKKTSMNTYITASNIVLTTYTVLLLAHGVFDHFD